MVAETKPEFVSFEMDVFWVVHPGQDPVKLMQKYPNRWSLLHLKDLRKGGEMGNFTRRLPRIGEVAARHA